MADEVSICNFALDMLGADPITSLGDATKAARLCARNYPRARDASLRAYPWNCAMARARLAAATAAPAFGYLNAFPLPAEALRVWRIPALDEAREPWVIEGRAILTDAAGPLDIQFIARVTDPAQFDPLLADVIGMRLAADLAVPLSGSAALAGSIEAALTRRLREAKGIDATEQSSEEIDRDASWLAARTI